VLRSVDADVSTTRGDVYRLMGKEGQRCGKLVLTLGILPRAATTTSCLGETRLGIGRGTGKHAAMANAFLPAWSWADGSRLVRGVKTANSGELGVARYTHTHHHRLKHTYPHVSEPHA
jgi:hypothetical protein